LDKKATTLDEALAMIASATSKGEAISVGLLGNAAEIVPELVRRARAGGMRPDIVTDQTSAHDPLSYLPLGVSLEDWQSEAEQDAEKFTLRAEEAMDKQLRFVVRPMLL
ncbi:urocanate hydratase, partial [Mycobacterium tuberculosis]|nr:urocanate hydratase [Mycobacterium tuberculosis]